MDTAGSGSEVAIAHAIVTNSYIRRELVDTIIAFLDYLPTGI